MKKEETWVKIYRSLEDWEWYTDCVTKSVYLHLLLKANHKDHKFKGMIIKRGSIVTGRKKLAEQLGLSEQQIRTSFNRLKSTSYITTKSTNKFTLVTLVNYDKHQNKKNDNNKFIDSIQPTTNQQLTNNQPQYKNDKNDKINTPTTKEEINQKISLNISLINIISKQLNKNVNIIENQISIFTEYIFSIGKTHKNDEDLFSHFSSWINKQDLEKNKDVTVEINWFIDKFNLISRREYKVTEIVKTLFINQLNNGFTGEQMLKAVQNLYSRSDKNDFNKKTNYQHATPEFLLKNDNLNKYLNMKL